MESPKPKWLGSFYGGNLGFLNYEVLTIQHIPRKETLCEADLMQTKWFDYRRLHPMQATYYFARCYLNAYRNFYSAAIDASRAPYVRGFKENDFLEAHEKMVFWRGRQVCDRLGIPYDFFFSVAMRKLHKMMDSQGRVYPPRPQMICSNDDLVTDVALAWEEYRSVSLQFATDPYFRVSNFEGSAIQLAHEAYVIEQIKMRMHRQYSLHAALYIYDVLRIEEALRHFEESVVLSAIAEMKLPKEISHC